MACVDSNERDLRVGDIVRHFIDGSEGTIIGLRSYERRAGMEGERPLQACLARVRWGDAPPGTPLASTSLVFVRRPAGP